MSHSTNNYRYGILAVVLITLVFSLSALFIYVPKTLEGDFNKFFLPSEMFGVPHELKDHGINALYSKYESGWDGQFYYYISNDILGVTEVPEHIDAPSYRYQRIGLPLLANIVSHITFQDWVSPFLYYATSLVLILLATYMFAGFLLEKKINPFWALGWALAFGTQVTLLNGLPDAAADALLIIAIISLIKQRYWVYMLAMSFAALAREVYIIFPFFILIFEFYRLVRLSLVARVFNAQMFKLCLWHIVPLILFLSWQLYLKLHFGASASSEAAGILSLPFLETFKYLWLGLSGQHPLFPGVVEAHKEAARLIFYLMLLVFAFIVLMKSFGKFVSSQKEYNESNHQLYGLYISFFVIILLYVCFGPTVMMHYTGYLKAASIFLFVMPFFVGFTGMHFGLTNKIFIVLFTVIVSVPTFLERINVPSSYSMYTRAGVDLKQGEPACIVNPKSEIKIEYKQDILGINVFSLVRKNQTVIYYLKVINTSKQSFVPAKGKGAVNLSYQWLDAKTKSVVKDGIRTWLKEPMSPGGSEVRPVVVEYPKKPGHYILVFSLVQEGCFWFYQKNSESSLKIDIWVK